MIDCVPEKRTVSLMEVHVFTEYHDSTEQDFGKIAKGCAEVSTIKDDRHHRRGHNIGAYMRLSASLLRQIYQARRKSSCQRHNQTESDADDN